MGPPLEPEEHPHRVLGVRRLLQDLPVLHHDGVGREHQAAGHPLGLLPREPPGILQRRLPRQRHLGHRVRVHQHRVAEHLEQLLPAGRGGGEDDGGEHGERGEGRCET